MTRQNEDVTKLPKWAQDKIAYLQRDLRDAEERWTTAEEGKTDISWQYLMEKWHHLPEWSTVRFETASGRVDVRLRDGVLEISVDGTMRVSPRSANMVWVTQERLGR